ncbi:alpha/beta fold hydrolase [Halomicroarcula sp. GCM10025709]|uniref:alpha/beta fold hydrolase n=1 Tax=Haloarcula TaxID=2237 RepID=UPI0024C28395|nr:hypothetical protein [Halomicroarcula sp. YJ-61-S]
MDDADARIVREEFLTAVERTRSGVVTEARLLADPWGFDVAAADTPVRLWHGSRDTNVPLAGARELADRLPDAELHVTDTDHLTTLTRSRERVLAAWCR